MKVLALVLILMLPALVFAQEPVTAKVDTPAAAISDDSVPLDASTKAEMEAIFAEIQKLEPAFMKYQNLQLQLQNRYLAFMAKHKLDPAFYAIDPDKMAVVRRKEAAKEEK